MPRFSVLIPTHEHATTLAYAVRSVQMQAVDDIEILICGDGVSDAVRDQTLALARQDRRIKFFDLPKAPARGELNRDFVMRQAQSPIICHQNDDDLWLPGHFEVLAQALEKADFVGAIQVNVDTDDKVRAHYFDLERPEFVEPWLKWKPNEFGPWACNGFGPVFVAHTREAFLRLPEGWTTTPDGLPADQMMWHRFLREPWCRARFLRWPIALHFPSPDRSGWSAEQRGEEMRRWSEIVARPDYAERIWRDLLPDLCDRLLRQSLEERRNRELEYALRQKELEYALRQKEYELRRSAERERDALLWRFRWLRRARHPMRSAASVGRECGNLVRSLRQGHARRSADLDPQN
jgi:GalNAc5-diNAcBac-PP-undecaprenol beta-1,3-glucosyltransferase